MLSESGPFVVGGTESTERNVGTDPIPLRELRNRKCCNYDFPSFSLNVRKLMCFGCCLLFGCGIQLLLIGLEEAKEFRDAIGSGYLLTDNYYKVVGSGIFFLSALICAVGTGYHHVKLLIVFIVLMVINLGLMITCDVLTRQSSIEKSTRKLLNQYIKDYYDAKSGSSQSKKILNHIQHEFSCCGSWIGVEDYANTEVLPDTCCYNGGMSQTMSKMNESYCNKTMLGMSVPAAHAVHPSPCARVVARYMHAVLTSSDITVRYCLTIASVCIILGSIFLFQTHRAKKKERKRLSSDEEQPNSEDIPDEPQNPDLVT